MFDKILHQPVRSKLVATLIQNTELPFKALKNELDLTDGNLSTHLKKLKDEDYIDIKKTFENNKPKTIVNITPKGKKQFKEYLTQLKNFVNEN